MNLKKICGLDLYLDGHHLKFGQGLPIVTPAVRLASDMAEVLYRNCELGRELYYMYRDIAADERKRAVQLPIRYDITIITPGMNGCEYNKTAGHYHPVVPSTTVTYPEVYEVLYGTAHYLLQKLEDGVVTDVVLVEAAQGDKVLIPPGYGHITINPTTDVLVMSNWVADNFSSVYEPIAQTKGGAYFEVEENGASCFVMNPAYQNVPPLRRASVAEHREFGLIKGEPMFVTCLKNPELFRYLLEPQDYLTEFSL